MVEGMEVDANEVKCPWFGYAEKVVSGMSVGQSIKALESFDESCHNNCTKFEDCANVPDFIHDLQQK